MPQASSSARRTVVAQSRDLPLDSHLHTALSPDSKVPMELYAASAHQLGIREICLTDHLDFMPGAPAYDYADYPRRERLIRELQERWAGKVRIRFGVELTYETRYEDRIREHLRTHRYDYAIGSVHVQSDGPYAPDRIDSFMAGKDLTAATEFYRAEVMGAIRSRLFDTIGHLDQCKTWFEKWFSPADYANAPELYEPLLVALVESGSALEVNTGGLHRQVDETYPAEWVVRRFRDLGGQRVTVGSDSHLPQHFAFGLEEACQIIAAAGFDRLSLERALDRGDLVLPERFGLEVRRQARPEVRRQARPEVRRQARPEVRPQGSAGGPNGSTGGSTDG